MLEVGRLADNYLLARKRNRVDPPKQNGKREGMGGRETRRCHTCGQEGHLARNCTKKDSSNKSETEQNEQQEKTQSDQSERKCYNCH